MTGSREAMMFYSCFVIDDTKSWDEIHQPFLMMPFRRGRSQELEGLPKEYMFHKHTNLPRGGRAGLPMAWEFDVERITTFADREASPVLDNTRFAFRYDLETVAKWKGMDEIFQGHDLPVSMRENIPFWVEAIVPCGWDVGDRTKERRACEAESANVYPRMAAIFERTRPVKNGVSQERFEMSRRNEVQSLEGFRIHGPAPGETTVWIVLEGHGKIVVV